MNTVRFNPLADAAPAVAEVHELILLPQRAIYWPAEGTLLIADLHLGKTQTFWAAGVPMPAGVLEADLARLDELLRGTECHRIIVLGDLLHATIGLTDMLVETVAAWRSRWRHVEVVVIPGNHDRALNKVALPWQLTLSAPLLRQGGFAFRHDPEPTPGAYTLCGHLHPLVRVRGAGDALRLPCFWMGPEVGVLPPFSAFTRGITVQPAETDAVFVLVDGRVVPI